MSNYAITAARLTEIIASDARLNEFHANEVEDYCCDDWSEGQAHQDWLDTAPAAEIASWVFSGLQGIRADRNANA